MFEATFKSSVDLPTPGLPPMREREPGTIPPPKTPSSSTSKELYL